MALVSITNLGGSIRINDTRFAPEITNVDVLKDGLAIFRFGEVVRITFVAGNWIDIRFDEVELYTFTSLIVPIDSVEFFDELWKILEDYCDCSTCDCSQCQRMLEDGTGRNLENNESRDLESCLTELQKYDLLILAGFTVLQAETILQIINN
jgi:hypothetical protein